MRYLARFNPLRAVSDLRRFLSYRSGHELWFGFLSVILTGTILTGLALDSRVTPVYTREVIYVEDWRLDRSIEETVAQQAIDKAARDERMAEVTRLKEKRKAEFKKVDDALKSWGI